MAKEAIVLIELGYKNKNSKYAFTIIGGRNHPFYGAFTNMKTRCHNPKCKEYKWYGGRGIVVCDRWLGRGGFQNFYDDMLPTWQKGLTLDRRETNGNYEKDNCRWVSMKDQQRNRNSNHLITYNGQTRCLAEWAEELNIMPSTFQYLLFYYNGNIEQIIKTPFINGDRPKMYGNNNKHLFIYNGISHTISQLAKKLGVKPKSLGNKLYKKNDSLEYIYRGHNIKKVNKA